VFITFHVIVFESNFPRTPFPPASVSSNRYKALGRAVSCASMPSDWLKVLAKICDADKADMRVSCLELLLPSVVCCLWDWSVEFMCRCAGIVSKCSNSSNGVLTVEDHCYTTHGAENEIPCVTNRPALCMHACDQAGLNKKEYLSLLLSNRFLQRGSYAERCHCDKSVCPSSAIVSKRPSYDHAVFRIATVSSG